LLNTSGNEKLIFSHGLYSATSNVYFRWVSYLLCHI